MESAAPSAPWLSPRRLLGLNQEQMLHAFGIAGSHSAGTMEYDQTGGEIKRVHAGIAARGGIQAAMLARLGLTGPRRSLKESGAFAGCSPINTTWMSSRETWAAISRS